MNHISLCRITGIAFLAVCVLTQKGSTQTEPLFQCLSVPAMELRGQIPPPLNFQPSTLMDNRSAASPFSTAFHCLRAPSEPRLQGNLCERSIRYGGGQIASDFRNFYSCDTALNFGVALAGGAILANTTMDRHFVEWYQDDVRSSGSDNFAKFWKYFGEGQVWVPIFAVTAVGYRFYEQSDWNKSRERCLLGEYAVRTARGYLVGVPTLWTFQSLLGSGRPCNGDEKGSYWRPFNRANGVSGHAYVGAMPFITAAQMVESPWLKGVFYACSVFPAWSRINDDAHYLSQVILGWYLAYLSARAVSQTEGTRLPRGLTIFPITEGRSIGLGFLYKR